VVIARYENRSTIMTSNRPIQDWGKLLGDVARRQRHPGSFPPPRPKPSLSPCRSYRLKDQTSAKEEKTTQQNYRRTLT